MIIVTVRIMLNSSGAGVVFDQKGMCVVCAWQWWWLLADFSSFISFLLSVDILYTSAQWSPLPLNIHTQLKSLLRPLDSPMWLPWWQSHRHSKLGMFKTEFLTPSPRSAPSSSQSVALSSSQLSKSSHWESLLILPFRLLSIPFHPRFLSLLSQRSLVCVHLLISHLGYLKSLLLCLLSSILATYCVSRVCQALCYLFSILQKR